MGVCVGVGVGVGVCLCGGGVAHQAVVRAYRDREVVLQKEFARVVAQVAQLRERVHVAREARLLHVVCACGWV